MLSLVLRRSFHQTGKFFTNNTQSVQFNYKLIKSDRYKDVAQHLQKFFYTDEPLSKAAKLAVSGGNPDLEAYILKTLSENLSIMAVTKDDKIAGVALNGYYHKSDKEKFDEVVASCKTDNFRKIVRLLFDVNVPIDFFSKFSVDTILDARIVSVDSLYRQHKLAWSLMHHCQSLFKQTGLKVIKAETTGVYSYRLFEKMGYEKINEIVYDKYVDATGTPVLKVEPPHKSVKLVYKLIN